MAARAAVPSRQSTGRIAEDRVAALLAARGWRLLARNLRTPAAELDLLAEDPAGVLVVVEVKSSHPFGLLRGEEHLGTAQRRRLAAALEWLARREPPSRALRLDLAVVLQAGGELRGVEFFEGLAGIEAAQRRGGDALR